MLASTFSTSAPSAHQINRAGLGFRAGLTNDQLQRAVPSAFAECAHESRSDRYAYIPTIAVIEGLRSEGFIPVNAQQSKSRIEGKTEYTKHLIRFRREDQLDKAEAREVIVINSHDGSSAYKLSAGIFRLVCTNGLVVGRDDIRYTVRHSGDVRGEVIEGATRIIEQFDLVQSEIELMKGAELSTPLQLAFAAAAIEARFDTPEKPVSREQILRPRRNADTGTDAWTVFNRIQENIIRGGLNGTSKDALGRTHYRRTREVKGIDQSDSLNRALWTLAAEVAKLA